MRGGDIWGLINTAVVKCHWLWHKQALIYMSRDQTGILRLSCQRPAELDYIFLPGDGNGVQGGNELFCLIWILSEVVLPSETNWQPVPLFLAVLAGKNKELVIWEQHFWHLSGICGISATRGIVTRNICGVWVEDERAFRRHAVHPNLCHFLESIPNRTFLKEMISSV